VRQSLNNTGIISSRKVDKGSVAQLPTLTLDGKEANVSSDIESTK
jgi:hypothetical protein